MEYYNVTYNNSMPSVLIKTTGATETIETTNARAGAGDVKITNKDKAFTVSAGGLSSIKTNIWCATIGIIPKNPDANLSYFKYDKGCAMIGELTRGNGTIHILKTIVEFIKEKYKYVERINLIDSATIDCVINKEKSIIKKNCVIIL